MSSILLPSACVAQPVSFPGTEVRIGAFGCLQSSIASVATAHLCKSIEFLVILYFLVSGRGGCISIWPLAMIDFCILVPSHVMTLNPEFAVLAVVPSPLPSVWQPDSAKAVNNDVARMAWMDKIFFDKLNFLHKRTSSMSQHTCCTCKSTGIETRDSSNRVQNIANHRQPDPPDAGTEHLVIGRSPVTLC